MLGVSGLPLYEVVFGRQQPLAGLPSKVARVSEDVMEFQQRMESLDSLVGKHQDAEHRVWCKFINAKRKYKPVFETSSKMWPRRPASLSAGLPSV